ncbi:hypothetical protein D3C71_1449800 [compost metagenome]
MHDQLQRRQRCIGNLRRGGEIIGGAQWQQPQRRQRVGRLLAMRQRLGHLTERAITAGRDDRIHPVRDRLGHIALGIARFPGHPYLQLHPALTQRGHRLAHILVAGGLAVEDQTPMGTAHAVLPGSGEAKASSGRRGRR